MAIYKLVWDDFCSWYLEMIKPAYQQPIDKTTYDTTIEFFERLMELLHPFTPFITEELWQALRDRSSKGSIMLTQRIPAGHFSQELIDKFAVEEEVIMAIRTIRKEKNIPFKDPIKLYIRKNNDDKPDVTFDGVISKLCNISELGYVNDKVPDSISVIVKSTEFYVPMTMNIDREAEIGKLEEELTYTKGFLETVMKKLSNDRFVNSAPTQVVEAERKKKSDADARIKVLEEKIQELRKVIG